MPSAEKILYFLSSGLLSIIAVAILGYGLSENWVVSTMACSHTDNELFNGSAKILMGLFKGILLKNSCPLFSEPDEDFTVFNKMHEAGGAGEGIHAVVVVLLVFAMVGSAGSIIVTLYNSISNPYETFMGPIGLYVCSGLSACLACLAMVLYLTNLLGINIAKKILLMIVGAKLKDEVMSFLIGFYMIIPYVVLNLIAILLVYLYTHAAYRQRQEQQKPTEDAPKEILMY